MKKYILYNHGGSKNHGCEALVRSTAKLLTDKEIILSSYNPEEDGEYQINEVVDKILKEGYTTSLKKSNLNFLKAYLSLKIKNNYKPIDYYSECAAMGAKKNDIALSIGGDCYCYGGEKEIIAKDEKWRYVGLKTVLWGVSIEPELLENENIANDIKQFDLITARETISYEALKKVNPKTILVSDSAFSLDKIELPLPDGVGNSEFVGINSSPLVEKNETKPGITRENFKSLIENILNTTDMKILLIPHVIWENNDDRTVLADFYEQYKSTGRVFLVDDCNCEELKGYISRCRFFVGARTHATIAAYSTGVPTLVVGYSVKAKGIAKDIFGTDDNYVLPVQSLKNADDLTNAFIWLEKNEASIKERLKNTMPEYIKRVQKGVDAVKKL